MTFSLGGQSSIVITTEVTAALARGTEISSGVFNLPTVACRVVLAQHENTISFRLN